MHHSDESPKKADKPQTQVPENGEKSHAKKDTVSMARRKFMTLIAGALVGGMGIGGAIAKWPTDKKEAEYADENPPEEPGTSVVKKPASTVSTTSTENPEELAEKREKELGVVSTNIKEFMEAFEKGLRLKDDELYSLYEKELKKLKREDGKELQVDAFREAVMKYILEKITTLSEEEKSILTQNKYFVGRTLHLAHMTCSSGENIAGGKRQIDSKASIAKNFGKFKKNHEYGKAIANSKKLAELIDPNVLFALIRNETDFVNFYNSAEGVSGPFQFTTAMPPKSKDKFDLPKDLDTTLEELRTGVSENLVKYVLLLRKKFYNEFYDKLDDIEDNTIRKEVALGVAWLHANMKAIEEYYKDNSMVKDKFAWLMAIAFYNANIARISEDAKEDTKLPDRIMKDSVSAFIETLPFYKGSGAGKLYTPRVVVGYELLNALDRCEGDADEVDEKALYTALIQDGMRSNCGLPARE